MDAHGRLYLLDEHTYCVHVFSPGGERVLVCEPGPRDVPDGAAGSPNVTVSDRGEIFVGREGVSSSEDGGGYIRFSAEGERSGIVRLGLDSITEEWHFQPRTGNKWVRCYEEIVLVDGTDRVIRRIERRPDGYWLERPDVLAVAPDGSAVLSDHPVFASASKPFLSVYSAHGEPVCTFPNPTVLAWPTKIAYSGEWVAGMGYEGPLVLFDGKGKPLLNFDVGKRLTPGEDRFLFFSPDGKELRVLDAETRIVHRFAVPRAG